ncbi:MAG: TdeIII family type II restriction endonuclease [Bacillota bacterium]|nr:TdeIII family type II restriction endonuclease [Bacillota bacterium]
MDEKKKTAIQEIVDREIKNFMDTYETRYAGEVSDPDGVINSKKNNCFVAELGKEFMFYSAFVRSFDSSFGRVLEKIGNEIAKLSYDVRGNINSFLLPQQSQHMDYIILEYEKHRRPQVSDYCDFVCMIPEDTRSFERSHVTDHYFYNPAKKEHYLIELKAGGDLDNKKAKTEKLALLQEYFILKNFLLNKPDETIKLYFGTAYNKYGENSEWKQERVKQFFADEELLIGKDYWNFVCDDPEGFEIVFEQYRKSSRYINEALNRIKTLYFQ